MQHEPQATPQFQTSHSRWQALTRRSPSSHSSFLYGVKSTKIYCRPTCPARLARRANVKFYDTIDQARRDGFRACKRCKPDTAGFLGEREEVVGRVLSLLKVRQDGLGMKRGLKELAGEVGVTPSYLCRVFKQTMGVTLGTYVVEFEREVVQNETGSMKSEEESPKDTVTSSLGSSPLGDGDGDNFNIDEWFWSEYFNEDFLGEGSI